MENSLILVHESGRFLHVKDASKDYHCQFGMIKRQDLAKVKKAGIVATNKGVSLNAFRPFFLDSYKKIKRAPQIIPLKDVGAIVAETGIGKESVVVDSGTGSGALTIFLANIAKKVISYEIRKDFAKIARANIKEMGADNVVLKNKSIYDGIAEKNVDLITLDLPEPWKVLEHAKKALKTGGFLVSYSPTIPQSADFISAAKGFIHIKTIEIIQREWEFNERVIRPKSQPIGHSGFISVMRNVG